MVRRFFTAFLVAAMAAPAVVAAQGGTTQTLSGVVVDESGGVIPGANVMATHNGTGVAYSSVSNAQGLFVFPGLNTGTYTVTVSLDGFKTFVSNNVVLTSGIGANVRAVLAVGALAEQVVVSSASEILQTQTSTITATINTNQITKLPLTSRSAMDFVTFMPGISTPAGNRDSTISGLPEGTINITLDGVNIQDNTLRSTDGFFAIVSPRLDAIEEVTVTTAAQGADAGGQGAVQIRFVTRSGTNTFTGSGYHYYRSDKLNANTWFNNRNNVAKPKLKQNQQGVRVGGPIVLPGMFDGRGKAFFFFNYEEFRQPSDTTRNRTILNPGAERGIFSYAGAGGALQQVNLLALAAANGQIATADPTVVRLLGDVRTATGKTGSVAPIDQNLERFTYNLSVTSLRRYPTFRLDYNLSDKHRITSATNYQYFTDTPDTLNNFDATFPEFPVEAGQASQRLSVSNSLRSTLTPNLVNEGRVGYSGAPVKFFDELNTGMYTGSLANQNGFHLTFPTIGSALTSAGAAPAPQSRNATALFVEDTVTWLKGAHSITMGGLFSQFDYWAKNSNLVPRIVFGYAAGDPAASLFTAANFPGASAQNLTAAQNLYAFVTGRVLQITGDARLNESTGEYEYMGLGIQRARMRETDLYFQDQWRLRPNLTFNFGLRYALQFPFYPRNSSYTTPTIDDVCGVSGANGPASCNLFQAGSQPGSRPVFHQFEEGVRAYNVDYNNLSPSVGVVWQPDARPGFLGALMGPEGDFVVRAGYTRAFSRNGMNDFTGFYNANPGVTINANRSDAVGNLAAGGPVPVLFRDLSRLGPPAFSRTPQYPLTDVVTEDASMIDPNVRVPSADSWALGFQRSLGRDTSIEVRYVGTRSRDGWDNINYNEINIIENGFVNEFRAAQANLAANIAAGRGTTFAYTGAPGTAPLPTFLAFFNGQPASQGANAAAYTGANWTSATFQAFLARLNPNPMGLVHNGQNTGLLNSATLRQNAARAGLPANHFLANPDLLGGARIRTNVESRKYNALQLELLRRFAQGVQAQASYVFGRGYISMFETLRRPQYYLRDASTLANAAGDVTHAFKLNAVVDLPFGQGRRFGSGANGFVDRLVGGWQVGVASRIQSGRLLDIGNVRLVGMTEKDVRDLFKLRFDDAGRQVYMWPQEIIDQTIRAFSVSATSPTGYAGVPPSGRYFAPANGPDCIEPDGGSDYGDCGTRSLIVTGPMFRQTDVRISKRTRLVGRTDIEFAVEVLNAFNQANFVPVTGFANPFGNNAATNFNFINSTGNNIGSYQMTQLTGTNTARAIQLVSRFNW
jgi:hypothetical protein